MSDSMPLDPDLYRWSIDQYQRLAESGLLADEPVILIDGLLVTRAPKTPGRVMASDLASAALSRAIPDGGFVSTRNPITLAESRSVPEPDSEVVRGERRDYRHRPVEPGDVALVIEAVDPPIVDDRDLLRSIYARSSVQVFWIIDVVGRQLEVYSAPLGPEYRRRAVLGPGDMVPLRLDGREVARIAVGDLLP